MTVLLFTASRDWETVQNVVTRNSSSKPDQLNVLNSHQMLNCSDNFYLFTYLLIYLCIYLFIYLFKHVNTVRLERSVNVK